MILWYALAHVLQNYCKTWASVYQRIMYVHTYVRMYVRIYLPPVGHSQLVVLCMEMWPLFEAIIWKPVVLEGWLIDTVTTIKLE